MMGVYLLYTYLGPYVVGIGLAQANTEGHKEDNTHTYSLTRL